MEVEMVMVMEMVMEMEMVVGMGIIYFDCNSRGGLYWRPRCKIFHKCHGITQYETCNR